MVRQTLDNGGRYRATVVGGLAILVALGLLAAVVLVPPLIVRFDMAGHTLTTTDYVAAVHGARALLLQASGGLAVAVGAYAAWRRLALNAQEVRAVRDGQLTDRFIRAIEQLGNDKSVDIRVGAIFALERIARNSPDDSDAVIATLSSFIRLHSPWPPRLPEQPDADTPADQVWSLGSRSPDVQRALATIGQVPHSLDGEWIRIPNTDLRAARLWAYNLDFALLTESNLRHARVWNASLVGADLSRCDLRDAELREVDLRHALLMGADLRGADLSGAQLEGAEADANTRWPEGFDAAASGVVIVTGLDWRTQRTARRLQKLREDRLLNQSGGRRRALWRQLRILRLSRTH
jgi:hypothetical protein